MVKKQEAAGMAELIQNLNSGIGGSRTPGSPESSSSPRSRTDYLLRLEQLPLEAMDEQLGEEDLLEGESGEEGVRLVRERGEEGAGCWEEAVDLIIPCHILKIGVGETL